jgi:cytochrome c biogenesis protein ResB
LTQTPPSSPGSPPPEITFGDVGRALWRKLREMRTVFQILFVIAIAALLCAIIPQGASPDEYYSRYGRFLGNIIVRLSLDHVHSATWFILLIGVLLLSLVACSRRLWQEAALRWRIPAVEAAAQRVKSGGRVNALLFEAPAAALESLQAAAHRRGYRFWPLGTEGDQPVVYACRHRASAWGQTMAHYAVFLIALGSVLGVLPGLSLDRQVEVEEGTTYRAEDKSLPFDIAVDHFRIEQDPSTGEVRNYYSDVRLLTGQQVLAAATISVNHPLRYRGYFISQASWGLGAVKVEATRAGQTTPLTFPLARGGCPASGDESGQQCIWGVPQESAVSFLPGQQAALVATGFYADARREGKKVVGRETEYPGTPALNLTLVGGLSGQKQAPTEAHGTRSHSLKDLGWALVGESLPIEGGQVKFVGVTKSTGLGVRKDVGLPLVWLGFIATILGLSLIFYFPVQRAIIAFEPRGSERTGVKVGFYGGSGPAMDDLTEVWTEILTELSGNPRTASGTPAEEEANHE